MTFEVDASLDRETIRQQLFYWIDQTMTLKEDLNEYYAYVESEIQSIREGKEIYDLKKDDDREGIP